MSAAATWDRHHDGESVVIAIEGEIDLSNCDEVERAIRQAGSRAGGDEWVIDLGGVSFIDSSGLRAVYQGSGAGKGVRLRNPSPAIERLLDIAMPDCFVIEQVDPSAPARTLLQPEQPAVEPNEPA